MRARLLCALVAAFVAVPFLALQAAYLLQKNPSIGDDWHQLAAANAILLLGVCAAAADFPLASRAGRAVLVGILIPLLLPGPTVLDSFVRLLDPGSDTAFWLVALIPDLVLLLLLGGAEAAIYLLATRPKALF